MSLSIDKSSNSFSPTECWKILSRDGFSSLTTFMNFSRWAVLTAPREQKPVQYLQVIHGCVNSLSIFSLQETALFIWLMSQREYVLKSGNINIILKHFSLHFQEKKEAKIVHYTSKRCILFLWSNPSTTMHLLGVNKIQRYPFKGTVPVTSSCTPIFFVDTVHNSSELLFFFYHFIGTGSDVQVPKRHKTSRPSQVTSRPSHSHSSAFCDQDQESTSLSGNRNATSVNGLSNNSASGSPNNNLEPHSNADRLTNSTSNDLSSTNSPQKHREKKKHCEMAEKDTLPSDGHMRKHKKRKHSEDARFEGCRISHLVKKKRYTKELKEEEDRKSVV